MTPEKISTSCVFTALLLAWFLTLDVLGIEHGVALLGAAGVAPLLLHPLLGRLVRATATRKEQEVEATAARRTHAMLVYLRGQVDPSVRTILDCCSRITERSRGAGGAGFSSEAATVHYEANRLQDAVARAAQTATDAVTAELRYDAFGRPLASGSRRPGPSTYLRSAAGAGSRPAGV